MGIATFYAVQVPLEFGQDALFGPRSRILRRWTWEFSTPST